MYNIELYLRHNSVLLFPEMNTMKRLSYCTFLFVLWFAGICQAETVLSLNKITTEADLTNVANYCKSIYALNWYQNATTHAITDPVAGVTFSNQGGSSLYSTSNGYNSLQASYTVQTSNIAPNSAQTFNKVGGAGNLDKVLSGMIYDSGQTPNTKTRLAFNSLEEGKTYAIRMLARSWSAGANSRLHDFTIDLNADGQADSFLYGGNSVTVQRVSEDNPFGDSYAGAYAVDFTFVAQSSTAALTLTSVNNNQAWHNYGAVLFETSAAIVAPTTPTIYNPSFEADTFVISSHTGSIIEHGYISESHSGVISGWQTTDASKAGLAWTGSACQDFLVNQTPPDGNQVVFIQSKGDDVRLYQTISGFDPSDSSTLYRLTFNLGKRTGYENPNATVYFDDNALFKTTVSGGFNSYSTIVRPTASSQTLAFGNLTTGDSALLIDNVQLQSYKMYNYFSDTFSVQANSNTISPSSNDNANRFGGLVGSTTYTKYNCDASPWQIQLYNGQKDALMIATNNSGTRVNASPDHNFIDFADGSGQMYELSFKTMPVVGDTNAANWSAVIFGVSDASRGVNVNASDGVGILFRQNGGVQIFDDAKEVYSANNVITYDEEGWADISIQYYVPSFDSDSLVEVSLFINDEYVYNFQTDDGFTSNFFSLLGYSSTSNDYVYSYFKDLSMSSSAMPEPSAWVLLILGSVSLFAVRFARKSKKNVLPV